MIKNIAPNAAETPSNDQHKGHHTKEAPGDAHENKKKSGSSLRRKEI